MSSSVGLSVDETRREEHRPDWHVVAFQLGSEYFAVPIASVQEIIVMQPITRVPRAPSFVEGIINLRGRVIPVLDLAKRLKLERAQRSSEERIIVVESGAETVGMIVDGVSEVLVIPGDRVDELSSFASTVDTRYVSGVAKLEDRLVILLDLDHVLSMQELTQLGQFAAEASLERD